MKVIDDFGFQSLGITQEDFLKIGNIIQLGHPPLRIDLLTEIDGITFNDSYNTKELFEIDGLQMDFISYQDLIKNKKASGRHRDLDDLENLEE